MRPIKGRAKYEAAKPYTTPTGAAFASTPSYWVANAPRDTESMGLSYQNKGIDFGLFSKRIGTRYDAAAVYSATVNGVKTSDGSGQNITYDPFWMNNLFINYTLHNRSMFSGSKLKLSINNLLDDHDMVSVSKVKLSAAPLVAYSKSASDQLNLLPGRSFMVSFQMAISPRDR